MDHVGWLHTVQNFSPRSTIVKHFQKQNILYETFATFDQAAFDQIYSWTNSSKSIYGYEKNIYSENVKS